MTNLMVLSKKLQKFPKGTVVVPTDDKTVVAVHPTKHLGKSIKANKKNLEKPKPEDVSKALNGMVKHREKAIEDQQSDERVEKGTLLVIPLSGRSCAIYEVTDYILDHKPRLKIRYRRELTSGFEPAPESIGEEAEIEEAWATVIYLSNHVLLDKHDIVDDTHEVEAIKSKYEGRLIVAMDDHLDPKKVRKLEKFKAGEAVAKEDDDEYIEEDEYDEEDEYLDEEDEEDI